MKKASKYPKSAKKVYKNPRQKIHTHFWCVRTWDGNYIIDSIKHGRAECRAWYDKNYKGKGGKIVRMKYAEAKPTK